VELKSNRVADQFDTQIGSRIEWTALFHTLLKNSEAHSRELSEDEKLAIAPGAKLHARLLGSEGCFWRIADASINGTPVPGNLSYAFRGHWGLRHPHSTQEHVTLAIPPSSKARVSKWYFCVGQEACERQSYLIKTSVMSALSRTSLRPICIYSGMTTEIEEFLKRHGVPMVPASFPLTEDLDETLKGRADYSSAMAHGSYLRLMIPNIEREDEFVLYADYDCMFVRDPDLDIDGIQFIAAAPETDRDNWGWFNNGVLVINVPGLRSIYDKMIRIISLRLMSGLFAVHEQGEMNAIFWMKWNRLKLQQNWKPYWGANESAEIIHYHGPKPLEISQRLNSGLFGDDTIAHFLTKNVEGYRYYNALFASYGYLKG
jgi:Glycosyl transferase family 8